MKVVFETGELREIDESPTDARYAIGYNHVTLDDGSYGVLVSGEEDAKVGLHAWLEMDDERRKEMFRNWFKAAFTA